MRKHLTKIFAVMAMSVMSLTAQNAKAATTVNELVAIDKDWTFIADEITSNGTVGLTIGNFYCDGRIFTPTGNSANTSTSKGQPTIAGETHLNSLRLKLVQDRLAFKVAGPCTITFYTQSHDNGIILSKTDRTSASDPFWQEQPANTSR